LVFVDYFSDLSRSTYDVIDVLKKKLSLKTFSCPISISFFILWIMALIFSMAGGVSDVQLVYIWFLLVLALIDWQVKFLPDMLTLILLWLGLILSTTSLIAVSPGSAIWGATVAYVSSRLMNYLFYLWRGQDGLGRGDMKLLAAIAAWNGLIALLPIIFLASITAVVLGLVVILLKKDRSLNIPFGPFLSFAALFYLLLIHTQGSNTI
jgi:prepilin signal peptidase PulO-like enzyme (type II secretory pathway)